jgi:hypothetical protein
MNISILPLDIQSKILTYYFSYGTPCSKIIKQEINDKCKNNTVTLWRAKIDYEIRPGKKYMLQKYAMVGNWDVLWDLRLAMLEYHPKNQNSNIKHFCIDGAKVLKKNTIMKLLEEEVEILLSNYNI